MNTTEVLTALRHVSEATSKLKVDRKTHNEILTSLSTIERFIQSTTVPTPVVHQPAETQAKADAKK